MLKQIVFKMLVIYPRLKIRKKKLKNIKAWLFVCFSCIKPIILLRGLKTKQTPADLMFGRELIWRCQSTFSMVAHLGNCRHRALWVTMLANWEKDWRISMSFPDSKYEWPASEWNANITLKSRVVHRNRLWRSVENEWILSGTYRTKGRAVYSPSPPVILDNC